MMPMGSRPSKNEMKIEGKIRPVERVRIIFLRLTGFPERTAVARRLQTHSALYIFSIGNKSCLKNDRVYIRALKTSIVMTIIISV